MRRKEVEKRLEELKNKYQNKTIETSDGTLHIYYIFKAGQVGWEETFDSCDSIKNLENASRYIINHFGYLARNSNIVAIKKCYIISEREMEIFEY